MHEAKMHDDNCFVTLTYDSENIPKGSTLSVEDCQLFLKRLRRRLEPKRIKFFLAGEYGEKLSRPHYHAILFGIDFSDKVPLASRGEHSEWTSEVLRQVWGKGHVQIGSVTFESAAYVANYATKKITNKEAYTDAEGKYWPSAAEHYGGRRPEFLLMSRGGRVAGGIGKRWLDAFESDVFPSGEVIVRGRQAKPPRYYETQFVGKLSDEQQIAEEAFSGYRNLRAAILGDIKAKREEASEVPEILETQDGMRIEVAPGRNARRLVVREKVAQARAALKTRNLENQP